MNDTTPPEIGEISPLGQRYLDQKLQGSQLEGEFELSQQDDIPSLESLDEDEREELQRRGREALAGKVAFGVLAAGASSRMAVQDLPPECLQLMERSAREELPGSKALVPVYQRQEDAPVMTFLDLFLANVEQFRGEHQIDNPAVMLTSDANGEEIDQHLESRGVDNVLVFRQPLAPQIAATRQDVERAGKHFKGDGVLEQAIERAERWAGRDVLIRKPAGHGEFLHQLVSSGMLGKLAQRGVQYLSVRNIDNAAAVLDDAWLALLGYAEREQLDCLLEVCPRLPGQSGGALIRQHGQWRIAEDPSFTGLPQKAEESCYINNAVAIFRLDYFYKLYEVTPEELHSASSERLAEIADATRQRFPVIVQAKPVKLADNSVVGAVTPETNMWESTGVVRGAKVGAFAVPSERAAGEDFLGLSRSQRAERARQVRFSPTKTWDDYRDPRKRKILQGIADTLLERSGESIPAED